LEPTLVVIELGFGLIRSNLHFDNETIASGGEQEVEKLALVGGVLSFNFNSNTLPRKLLWNLLLSAEQKGDKSLAEIIAQNEARRERLRGVVLL
jgi:hypothetical protein